MEIKLTPKEFNALVKNDYSSGRKFPVHIINDGSSVYRFNYLVEDKMYYTLVNSTDEIRLPWEDKK